jgi:hypothetical protein
MALSRFASHADSLRVRAVYRTALAAVSEKAGVADTVLLQRRHDRAKTVLRRRALYLAVTVFNCPARAIARASGLDEKTVRNALRATEDERDDSSLDTLLETLEMEIAA